MYVITILLQFYERYIIKHPLTVSNNSYKQHPSSISVARTCVDVSKNKQEHVVSYWHKLKLKCVQIIQF